MNNSIEKTEYSISGIYNVIKENLNFLIITYIIIAISSLLYAVSLPNIYTASAVLYPASVPSSSDQSSSVGGSFGGTGIADIVGTLSGSGGGDQNTARALKILESKEFFLSYYNNNQFLADFEAGKTYDYSKDQILYDKSRYDSSKNIWLPGLKPNFDQAHANFLSILAIDHDRLDGFITLSLDNISPKVATYWLEQIILDINNRIKVLETNKANLQARYFENRLITTEILALRSVISSLLVQAYETLAFAEITDEFAFEYIDKPMIPDRKSKPSRGFIVIFLCIGIGTLELLFLVFFASLGKKISLSTKPLRLKIDSLKKLET